MKSWWMLPFVLMLLLCGCARTVTGSEETVEGVVSDMAMDQGRSYIGIAWEDGGACYYAPKGESVPGTAKLGDRVRIVTVLERGSDLRIPTEVIVLETGAAQASDTEIVSYNKDYVNITVELPKGWSYEILPEEPDAFRLGLCFWPEGKEDLKLSLCYYPQQFAVCGTGLTTSACTVAPGLEATKGTYDGDYRWDYLYFHDLAGDYAAQLEGSGDWWDTHGEQAMEILASAQLGYGLKRSQIETLAAERCTVAYDRIRSHFDCQSGIWSVDFEDSKTAEGQVVFLDGRGEPTEP